MKLISKIVFLLLVGASALTGCKKDKEKVKDDDSFMQDEYDFGKGELMLSAPLWNFSTEKVDPQNTMTVTMVVEGLQTKVQKDDKLVALIDDKCCGVAEPEFVDDDEEPIFFLLLSPNAKDMENGLLAVKLRYYSTMSHKTYSAVSTFNYETDAILGTLEKPYAPAWK